MSEKQNTCATIPVAELKRAADNIRVLSVAMVEKAKSGHPGGAMGGADFVSVLYGCFLRYNPDNMKYPFRDRFFLDPGHMSPMLYGVLSLAGFYSMEDIKQFRQWGTVTPGHPEWDPSRGVENSSGPLGQGHAMALGCAIGERFMAARGGKSHKIYAYISDGGIQEEVSAGVGRIAGHLGLSNFIMYYDANNVQLSTTVDFVDTENVAAKYEAWGWKVISIDGSNITEIYNSLVEANAETERPVLIIGRTIMGCGALGPNGESFENKVSTHGQPMSAAGADVAATIKNLGGDPENPFVLFDDAKALFDARREELKKWGAEQEAEDAELRKANPEAWAKLDAYFAGKMPEVDWDSISVGENVATRVASSAVLGKLAESVGNMVVSSADLCNSDKTDGFLKKSSAFVKGDFSGGFFQAGVSEFTMACVMNGLALHGGILPACGTFFVFSDYMKPVFRMSALMRQHVVYVWSHDSFRVGEDGPTHQPIEQEAQVRLMEQVRNHRGERSMVVLRPADTAETIEAWKIAYNEERPVALLLTRQNVNDLPAQGGLSRKEVAKGTAKGAYVVYDSEGTPDIVLVGNGSDVGHLVEGAGMLAAEGIKCRVVSAPSEGLFRDQSEEYQQSVLPDGIIRYGMTSGIPSTIRGLVGDKGMIHGLDHFGYSAPAKRLEQEFGYSGEVVYREVKEFLGK